MFTETQILKRIIKSAWKGSGLHVEHTAHDWLALSGFWWRLEVDYQQLNNKVKAQLIELIGEIPERGEGYLYFKNTDPQSEMPGTTYQNLLEKWTRCNAQYEITNVLLKTSQDNLAVLQCGDSKILIPEWAADLTRGETDDDGENEPGNGRSMNGESYVIWANNKMALAIFKRGEQYAGEREFIDAVSEVDLCWDFIQE